MNLAEIMAAWKDANNCDTHSFHERFFHLTGLSEQVVKACFSQWNIYRHTEVEALAEQHGTTVREAGFQAFLVEKFWPYSERDLLLRRVARYVREDHPEAADKIDNILDCNSRLGHTPLDWGMTDPSPEGEGDPREDKNWPPEEDCPACPGRQHPTEGSHKMDCSVGRSQSGRITAPLNLLEGFKIGEVVPPLPGFEPQGKTMSPRHPSQTYVPPKVHEKTAAKIFNKDEGDVTPAERRAARAVNFTHLYGGTGSHFVESVRAAGLPLPDDIPEDGAE